MKPRRENGATFVMPMTSDVYWGSALTMDFLGAGWEGSHSASDVCRTQITCLEEGWWRQRMWRGRTKNKAVGAV
jgi:hypothetical protein